MMKKKLAVVLAMVLCLTMPLTAWARDAWDCPDCGQTGNIGNFCVNCGHAAPEAEEPRAWDCPDCGQTGNTGNFCANCGHAAPKADEPRTWDCPECGQTGNTGNYCVNCGHAAPWLETAAEPAQAASTGADAASVAVGSYVTFGHYEQDGDTANGQEPIEWLVLDVQGGKVLLLSRYGLDAQPYNTEWVDITWEKCTLRAWLNSDFLNAAFTKEEQSAILTTSVDNSDSQGFDFTAVFSRAEKTDGGNDTQDKVFLLSYAEANKYLGLEWHGVDGATQNKKSRAAPTAYAIKQGAFTDRS